MKTEQVNVYKFSELSPKVQEEVLDKMREINTDYDWYDSDFEGFKEQLDKMGLSCDSFVFDLIERDCYMIKPHIDDIRKFLKSAFSDNEKLLYEIEEEQKKEFEALIDKLEEEYNFGIKESNGRSGYNYVEGLDEVGEILGYDYDEHIKDTMKDFLKQLQESYDYLESDEAIRETILSNEYYFLEDGERW